jgi:hypothetical protein
MKKIVVLITLMLAIHSLTIQAQTFEKGDFGINGGIGLGYRGFPVEFSATYGIVDDLFNVDGLSMSIGGYAAFSMSYAVGITNLYTYTNIKTRFIPAVRVLGHYSFFDNFEVYGGPALGYVFNYSNQYSIGNLENVDYPYVSVIAGAKYYFKDNFGVYVESGYTIGYLMGGITYKF